MPLRSSEKNISDLQKQLEESEKQLQRYETKLKDVVRAYKSLSSEKEALQATVVALTGQEHAVSGSKSEPVSAEADDSSLSPDERIGSLKKSLMTLISEKNRREAAFQADRKALLAENDSLKEKLRKTVETEAQAEELERRISSMSTKMKQIEEDRERELADHGSILGELQQRYAKERASATQMERQIAELYKKLQEKESCSTVNEEKYTALSAELKATIEEKEKWRLKAQKTVTVQMLESELENLKTESHREIAELQAKLTLKSNDERETRLHELEERLHAMSQRMADLERMKAENYAQMEELQKVNANLKKTTEAQLQASDESSESAMTEDQLKHKVIDLVEKLKNCTGSVDLNDLGFGCLIQDQKQKYSQLQDEFERYKLNAEAVLKCRNISVDLLENTIPEVVQPVSLNVAVECPSLANAEADLRRTRCIIASLHEKLQALEIDNENARREYEERYSAFHQTIAEMRRNHEAVTMELRQNMQQRIADMEAEMQKQRNRTMDALKEKEEELEIIKNQKGSQYDPVDPPQGVSFTSQHFRVRRTLSPEYLTQASSAEEKRKSSDSVRLITTTGRLPSNAESYSSIIDELQIDGSYTIPAVSSSTEAKNIFYEQELAKKDKLILELRDALQTAESRARDTQQASLTKELLQYEMVEKLREEINILEGKLNFYSSDANMEYLRNIFIQFLHCESSSGKKHILKAIGTVLKVGQNEMRHIDKR